MASERGHVIGRSRPVLGQADGPDRASSGLFAKKKSRTLIESIRTLGLLSVFFSKKTL
jgi:hypothetical protein